MSTSKVNLRAGLSREIGDFFSSSATASGSTSTVKDSTLAVFDTLYFGDGWILFTSGTAGNIGQVRRVTSHDTATPPVLTFSPIATATATSDGYEIHRLFSPQEKTAALNQARLLASNAIYLPLVNESLIAHNPLLNSDFEDWAVAGHPDNWTMSVITAAANTAYILHGSKSTALTRAGTNGYMYQDLAANEALRSARGTSVKFYAWGVASVADQLRLSVYDDSGVLQNGAYHTGNGKWELLSVEVTIPSTSTDCDLRVEVNGSNTVCYIDSAWLEGEWRYYQYNLPASFLHAPTEVGLQADKTLGQGQTTYPYTVLRDHEYHIDTETRSIRFSRNLPAGYRIRLTGRGILTAIAEDTHAAVSTDSGTMEISEPFVRILYAYAAMRLFQTRAESIFGADKSHYEQEAAKWQAEAIQRVRQLRLNPQQGAAIVKKGWG